jgi:hypothetical protein
VGPYLQACGVNRMFSQASPAGGEGFKYNPSGIREKAEVCGMADVSHELSFASASFVGVNIGK